MKKLIKLQPTNVLHLYHSDLLEKYKYSNHSNVNLMRFDISIEDRITISKAELIIYTDAYGNNSVLKSRYF
tara:strand:- start:589 stop:801 length:213 start_codon:yes stop_codon:yes gene_type:complete